MILRLVSIVVIALLVVPIIIGSGIAALPAFGYMPTLGGEQFSLAPWTALLGTPGIWHSIGVSFASALVTPTVALLVVFLFLASASGSRLDRWIRRLVSPLLSTPHAAAAFGLAFLMAPAGFLSRLVSPWLTGWESPPDVLILNDPHGLALMAGLIIKEIPFLLLMSLAALPQLDATRRVHLAQSLGYGPSIAWLKVVAPGLYPLIRLPIYAVIAFASSTVDVAMILGPNLPPTLSVNILHWYQDPDLQQRFLAASGALLQLGLTLAALATWRLLEVLCTLLWQIWIARGKRTTLDRSLRVTGCSLISITTLLAFLGIGTLALNSFAGFWRFPDTLPVNFTLHHWARVLPSMTDPIQTTFVIAVIATVIATALVLAALENEQRSGHRASAALWLLYLPLLVPQVTFLFGLVVATEFAGTTPNLTLVIFGHLLFVLPYVFLSLSEAYRHLDPRWERLAMTLGASRNRIFWRIRLPLLITPLLTAMAIGLAISVSQYLPTQLLGAGRVETITTNAVALASGGNRRVVGVWALVQALLPLVGFVLAMAIPRLLWRQRRGMRDASH